LLVTLLLALSVGGAWWLRRPHAIVYRASADAGCEFEVRFAEREREAGPLRATGAWQSDVIELAHGDVASIVVSPGPRCRSVRCELLEDGAVVARTEGAAAAICSAWTAR
jgi:hypothetical protein